MSAITRDGSASALYMKFDKILRSAQGMAIWQDRAFILYDTGMCGVYDLKGRTAAPLAAFPLGSYNEGMPTRDYVSYFNLDKVATISVDNSPRYEEKVLEETDEYRIYTTSWGATQKSWKKHGSTPEFLDFKIKDAEK